MKNVRSENQIREFMVTSGTIDFHIFFGFQIRVAVGYLLGIIDVSTPCTDNTEMR
jgi:hypothetical protein